MAFIDTNQIGRKADHGQRQIENPGEAAFERALPQGHGQVVFLALMMHDVRRPGRGVLVRDAMEPIKAEIDAEHQPDGRGPFRGRRGVGDFQQAEVLEQKQIAGKQSRFKKIADDLVDDAATQIVDRIVEAVELLVLRSGRQPSRRRSAKRKTAPPADVIDAGAENRVDKRAHDRTANGVAK